MNVKLKALVLAAVATLATSGAANATLTNAASGDSSLILTVLDNANNISALFDLGLSYNTFQAAAVSAPGTSFSWNVATGDYAAAWTTFLATADTSMSKFAVYAGDSTGAVTPGANGYVTTYNSGSTSITHSQMVTSFGNTENYINNNASLGNHLTVENGASTAISGTAFAENSIYGTNGKVGNQGNFVATGLFDTSLGVISVIRSSTSPIGKADITTYGNEFGPASFSFSSNGLLTYTVGSAPVIAVPEPESYAMMLAGLGLMGFVARRRKFSK